MLLALKKYSYNNNKAFYKALVKLALPMGLTSLLGSLLNILDTIMISTKGEVAVAAVGSGNRLFFIMNVCLFGIFSGFGVFISQFWGKKDLKRLQTVYMLGLFFGITISLLTTILALIIPGEIISLFTEEEAVKQLGITYLRYVSLSYVLSAILFSFDMVSRSTENVKLPFIVSIYGLIINGGLNYILIFGAFGFPEWGVKGAAIATVIARFIQLLIYIGYIIIYKNQVLLFNIKNFVFDKQLFSRMVKRVTPVVLNETAWAIGTTFVFMAYCELGTDANASMNLFESFIGLFTVFTWGVANSSAIILGKKYGEKQYDEAKWIAKLYLFTSIIFGIFTGLIMILSIPLVPVFFPNQSGTVHNYMQLTILIFGFFMPIKLLAGTFIVGIMRSGGDTTFALAVEILTLWGYAVPISFLLVSLTPLTLPLVYLIVCFEEVIKDLICYFRYRSGKYIHNLVH